MGGAALARLTASFGRFWCGRCCSRLTYSVIREVLVWEVLLSPDSQRHSGGMVLELLLPDSQRHSGGSGAGAALALLTESFWRF